MAPCGADRGRLVARCKLARASKPVLGAEASAQLRGRLIVEVRALNNIKRYISS
jgi:hypothetical protein